MNFLCGEVDGVVFEGMRVGGVVVVVVVKFVFVLGIGVGVIVVSVVGSGR